MEKKKILILPRYTSKGPSSRVRMYQYLPYFSKEKYSFEISPFFDDAYIDELFRNERKSILSIINSYINRFKQLLRIGKFDIVWIQYELFPWVPFFIEKFFFKQAHKVIIDFDDAVSHRYDQHSRNIVRILLGNKINKLISKSNQIISGNEYLSGLFNDSTDIEIVSSSLETSRYSIKKLVDNKQELRIGWIGTPITAKFLLEIEEVVKHYSDSSIKWVIIGARLPFDSDQKNVDFIEWTLTDEVDQVKSLDIGIMPLVDEPFERGKCGYKLIQYMACGLPVIASPVGINSKLVINGVNGYLAKDHNDWIDAINKLHQDSALRKEMGLKGRQLVEESYSVEKNIAKIENIFDNL